MKQLTWKLVLPLTVISFATFTKWWYVLPVDAPDTMMAGFPMAYLSEGWHTSMSLQIFVVEFLIDLLTYFMFWFLLVFCINRLLIKIRIHKILTILLLTLTGLIMIGTTIIFSMPEHVYKSTRDFEITVLETGYKFFWQKTERPDFEKYDVKDIKKE
ncbi:hypothetical protein QQ008_06540 [Fulvivirgaceae bacterium BMA10]|uniref:Uncharacterized protein n=1 Tax=Splendidivirga corallicola TaxID=3051826 RepID=A0ABT8KL98_9BACT|nr:hypothetical protein [Fulvivirgaceae bacterium BMA10]